MGRILALALTLIAGPVAAAAVVSPTGVVLERLIDSSVQLPGTTDPLVYDDIVPVPCGEGVVVTVAEPPDPMSWGYYVTSEGVEVIADPETVVAGSGTRLEEVTEFRCVEGGRVAFLGLEASPSTRPFSLYEWSPGGIVELVQSGGITVNGQDIGPLVGVGASVSGYGLVARLHLKAEEALLRQLPDQPPVFVADENVILPNQTSPVIAFSSPSVVESDLVFGALTLQGYGLYRWSPGGGIGVLADHQTQVPGSPNTFDDVYSYALLDRGIAFDATSGTNFGIFLRTDKGTIEPLVVSDQTTVGNEPLYAPTKPSGTDRILAFQGLPGPVAPFDASIFARLADGSIVRILGESDVIEGREVLDIDGAAEGRQVVLRVVLAGSEEPRIVIYRASFTDNPLAIPTLSQVGSILLVATLLFSGLFLLGRTGS